MRRNVNEICETTYEETFDSIYEEEERNIKSKDFETQHAFKVFGNTSTMMAGGTDCKV